MKYDSKEDTEKHIKNVVDKLGYFTSELAWRGMIHDKSKLEDFEKKTFDIYTPRLKNTTYNSDEYKENLKEMEVALDHHYENNRHHPEYFKNGINDMTLIDIVEMFTDWWAATERHEDGDMEKSINMNSERFNMSEQMKQIFLNTLKEINERKKISEE